MQAVASEKGERQFFLVSSWKALRNGGGEKVTGKKCMLLIRTSWRGDDPLVKYYHGGAAARKEVKPKEGN